MPRQLFVFLQLEFPWVLGPADGRYLLRAGPDADPERVVVVESLGAKRAVADLSGPAAWLTRRAARGRSERDVEPEPEAAPVATTRVTVVDPVPLSADGQARAWLEELDRERDVAAAVEIVNRVVQAHRVASADPYVREVSAAQALVIRGGWGEGEQVAYGRWVHARELSLKARRSRRRRDSSWALRPQERLAAMLTGRNRALLCEELVLRARLDLDQGRPALAAVGLDRALAAALAELSAERREDLALRLAELEQLRGGVATQATAVLNGETGALDEELLSHALARTEATLRARTAPGV